MATKKEWISFANMCAARAERELSRVDATLESQRKMREVRASCRNAREFAARAAGPLIDDEWSKLYAEHAEVACLAVVAQLGYDYDREEAILASRRPT